MIHRALLTEAYFLIDKLESTLTLINPVKNIKDIESMVALQGLLSKCISARKHLNKKYENEEMMESFDHIGEQLTKAFETTYK